MQIGPYELSNNLVLAPMAGVTDLPFRQLCRRQGAGLIVSEMLTSDPSLWHSRKSMRRLPHADEPGPVSIQIAGGDPTMMAQAARQNVDLGAQIIDINMGCPAKKVCNKAAGSALLQDEDLVARILDAVVAAVAVPVTLKIRTGWDRGHKNGVRVARLAEAAGIQALAVHGRTRADLYQGEAEYDTIRAIKMAVGIPVLANGDIDSPAKARQVLAHTGADGVMIGRAAQGRPWLPGEIAHFLAHGRMPPPASLAWQRDVLLGHLENLYAFYGEFSGVRVARKHIAWYCKAHPAAEPFRQRVVRVETCKDQLALTRAFFDQLIVGEDLAA